MADTAPTPTEKSGKIPLHFQLGDKLIDGATVRAQSFADFAGHIAAAHKMTQPAEFSARLLRVRMTKQVAYHINGATVPLSPEEVLRLPLPEFYKVVAGLDDGGEAKPGKIIRDGDGVNVAIVFELATPLPVGAGKAPITELEFLAPTYGDVEDVLSADGPAAQTAVLLQKVARPLGSDVVLQRLPEALFRRISVVDGTEISNTVLPRFLGQPSGSPPT